MDKFIDQLPFFTPEHRTVAADIQAFVAQEIEPRAAEERDIEAQLREFVGALAEARRFELRGCLARQETGRARALPDSRGAFLFFSAC